MTPTAFSSKQRFLALYRQILKRNRALIVLSTIITLILYPMQYLEGILRRYGENREEFYTLLGPACNYTEFSCFFVSAIVLGLPLLTASILLHYLHDRKAADVYHALPISRKTMLGANFAAGMTVCIFPFLLSNLCILIMGYSLRYPHMHPGYLLLDTLCVLAMLFVFLSFAFFTAVSTGTAFDHVLFFGTILFFPAILYAIIPIVLSIFTFQSVEPSNDVFMTIFSPSVLFYRQTSPLQGLLVIGIWTLLAAVFLYGTFRLYQKRKSELSGILLPHSPPKNIIRSCVVILTSFLLGGIFFLSFYPDNLIISKLVFVAGCAVGGALSYAVIESILSRGFSSLKRSRKWMGLWAGGMAAFSGLLLTAGVYAADSYVPKLSHLRSISLHSGQASGYFEQIYAYSATFDLSKAYLHTYPEPDTELAARGLIQYSPQLPPWQGVSISSQEGMELLLSIHQQTVQDYQNRTDRSRNVLDSPCLGPGYITYHFQNGSTLSCDFSQISQSAIPYLQEYYRCEELLSQTNPLFSVNPEDVLSFKLLDPLMLHITETLPGKDLSPEEVQALWEAMREDTREMMQRDFVQNPETPLGNIIFHFKPIEAPTPDQELSSQSPVFTEGYMQVFPSSSRTLQVLRELHLEDAFSYSWEESTGQVYLISSNNGRYLDTAYIGSGNHLITPFSSHSRYTASQLRAEAEDYSRQEYRPVLPVDFQDAQTMLSKSSILQRENEDMYMLLFLFPDETGGNSITGRYIRPEDVPETYLQYLQEPEDPSSTEDTIIYW